MLATLHKHTVTLLGIVLCLYTLAAVNYNVLQPQSALALFMLLGMVLCFLVYPAFPGIKPPQADDLGPTRRRKQTIWIIDRVVGYICAALSVVTFGYVFTQIEPMFESWWQLGVPIGERPSQETPLDIAMGAIGLVLVLEATRRTIGWIVPILAMLFLLHAYFARSLPSGMLRHPGLTAKEIVSTSFLQSQGVMGVAAGVMFKYVFLFVVFGALLEVTGATRFVINFAERFFGAFQAGPALVAVVGSGLMGSLSGSAVANAMTTGAFTIPTMRNAGFKPAAAGGITAAAASGAALVPPVMGAAAYMMMDFIKPQVSFLEIARAAIIPSLLYYLSLMAIVILYARREGASVRQVERKLEPLSMFEGVVFFGALAILIGLLAIGKSPFKAVSGSLVFIVLLTAIGPKLAFSAPMRTGTLIAFFALLAGHQLTMYWDSAPLWLKPFVAPQWVFPNGTSGLGYVTTLLDSTVLDSLLSSAIFAMFGLFVLAFCQPRWRPEMVKALTRSSKNGISLVAASACVGIIIAIVTTTPMAATFGTLIKGVVETNQLLALVGIMVCSLILGMGVPSVVCYLLMATLMGALLTQLGTAPLAAHLFIFYFGMMSMVTPPVALAAYASASIAEARIMPTAWASFRFALVGFTLPYMFVYRPALLFLNADGQQLITMEMLTKGPYNELGYSLWLLAIAVVWSVIGIIALAAGIAGFWKTRLSWVERGFYLLSAAMLLAPHLGGVFVGFFVNLAGAIMFTALVVFNVWFGKAAEPHLVAHGKSEKDEGLELSKPLPEGSSSEM